MLMDADEAKGDRLSRWEKACSIGCLVVFLAVVGVVLWGAVRYRAIDETDYAQVQLGMPKAQVQKLLGKPDRVYLKTREHPDMRPYLGASPQEGRASTEIVMAAREVWRWSRWLDQRIGVVFDREGKVIFKWLDY